MCVNFAKEETVDETEVVEAFVTESEVSEAVASFDPRLSKSMSEVRSVVRSNCGGSKRNKIRKSKEVKASCMKCDKPRRRGLVGMVCDGCGGWVHKKCCGLNRWRRGRTSEWRCGGCRDDQAEPEERDTIEEPRGLVARGA